MLRFQPYSGVPALPFDESSGSNAPLTFGGYRVLHQLGSGVLGPVFRAHDPAFDRILAVKAVKLDLIPEDATRLAEAVANIAGQIVAHPSIVPLVEVGVEGATPYVVTECALGETLDVVMRGGGPASPAMALPLLGQVAGAIDAAWAGGAGHGMLHPRDVFVETGTMRARVTGLGMAEALERVGVKVPVRRPYTAPERVNGDSWDRRADIFSLAAVAQELLTGRRPVGTGEQDGAFAADVTLEQATRTREALARGLAADPSDRYDSAGELVGAIEAALLGDQLALPIDDLPVAPPPVLEHLEHDVAEVGADTVAGPNVEPARELIDDLPLLTAPPSRPTTPMLPPPPLPASTSPWIRWVGMAMVGLTIGAASLMMFRADSGSTQPVDSDTEVDLSADPPLGDGDTSVGGDTSDNLTDEPERPPSGVAAPVVEASPPARPPAARVSAPTGQLLVRSEPAGALVLVNGELRGETPATVRDLPLGDHSVQIARPGYGPVTEQVRLTPASPSRNLMVTLQAALDPSATLQGSVVAVSRPLGARVLVDGRFVGLTPLRVPRVAPGRHQVRLELTGYQTVIVPVVVSGGQEARAAATLLPTTGRAGGR